MPERKDVNPEQALCKKMGTLKRLEAVGGLKNTEAGVRFAVSVTWASLGSRVGSEKFLVRLGELPEAGLGSMHCMTL